MYAILDIESTGGPYNKEGIMEIAIYRFDGYTVVDEFSTLINPQRQIQPFVAKLTGIDQTSVHNAPKFCEIAQRIVDITQNTILVAHNAQFDYRILRTEFRRIGYEYQRKTLCTVALSQKLFPDAPSYSLGKLVHHLGIAINNRHRASGDAQATLALFKLLLHQDTDKSQIKQLVRAASHGELSSNQMEIVSGLPPETGVYAMYNKDGELLFLESAENVKKKVTQHFNNKIALAKRLQKATKKVTCKTTGSALIAKLQAYQERSIKHSKYNAIGKNYLLFSHAINCATNNAGYMVLEIVKSKFRENQSIGFESRIAAQNFLQNIITEFQLCPISIKSNTTCSQTPVRLSQEKRKTNAAICNEKVRRAFEQYTIMTKSIVLLDRGRKTGEQSFILIKEGKLKGFGYSQCGAQIDNTAHWEAIMTPMAADINTTFIIESYLRKNNSIQTLTFDS